MTLAQMPRRNVEDYKFIIERLEGLPVLIDQALHWIQEGLERGITPPRITLRDVPSQVRNLLTDDAFDSPLLEAFHDRPVDVSESDWTDLRKQAELSYRSDIAPALARLLNFLESEYLVRATISLAALPNGDNWYRHRVKTFTTT